MGQFSGVPTTFNRFLGYFDQDDPTNIPIGLAAVCRNADFTASSVDTRAGINLTMQGLNKTPITGILGMAYTPETPTDTYFQFPMAFDLKGALQYESPVGSGRMKAFPEGLFTPPAGMHMLGTSAGNRCYLAFSNLITASSGLAVANPKTLNLDPYGMKPVGWTWLAAQLVLVGEVATPTVQGGNGHTYRCIEDGKTGAEEPVWPTTENGTVVDGTAKWEEYTMVMANRIPPPAAPVLALGVGTIPAMVTVYILLTFTNGQGETVGSASSSVTTTAAGQGVTVTLPTLASLAGWMQNLADTVGAQYAIAGCSIYEASVASGSAAPSQTEYQKVGGYPLGSVVTVTEAATSEIFPPGANTARITPGQLATPDVEPTITREADAGTFPAGRDVYVLMTYLNGQGETPAGPASSIIDTDLDDGIAVTVAAPAEYPQVRLINIYEADVPTGDPAPASTEFALVGSFEAGTSGLILYSAAGQAPPTVNTTGPGGNIVADTSTGGINGTQGMRYAALMFMNRNETVSGFTQNSVVSYIVDEDGWEIATFNVATGPANIVGRIVGFTVADGTQDGPFYWNGLVDLEVPSQNVVYPQNYPSDGIDNTATIFLDNVTRFGTFNFTDEYLESDNDVTDRLRVLWPPQAVRIDYLPSVDRMALTGVAGLSGGTEISLGGDYESFYGDTSPVPVSSTSGERSWGVVEFRNVIYLMRERSGVILTPTANDPSTWDAKVRWDSTGPCGPRAFDSVAMFMIYVHESGIYRYVDTAPDLMTKEMPRFWSTINWAAAQTICVTIDEYTHTVRFQFPVNGSPVPNLEVSLSYIEGWQNPVHYSTYSGKEIAMDAARRFSLNDVQAFVCTRLYRTIPQAGQEGEGEDGASESLPVDQSFFSSQLVYGSSGADGGIHARTPGIFNDNGQGIDFRYRTASAGNMMALSKTEGFTLNAKGNGTIDAAFWAARDMKAAWSPTGKSKSVPIRSFDLVPDQSIGISRKVPTKLNEFWGVEFSNGKRKDVWCSLKFLKVYNIPFADSREEGEG